MLAVQESQGPEPAPSKQEYGSEFCEAFVCSFISSLLILTPSWMIYALLFCPQQLVGHAGFEKWLWHRTKQRLWDAHQQIPETVCHENAGPATPLCMGLLEVVGALPGCSPHIQ